MLQFTDGMRVRCKINDLEINDVLVYIEKDEYNKDKVFLCQNICDGERCSNTHGYRYSWVLYRNDINNPGSGVTNVRF